LSEESRDESQLATTIYDAFYHHGHTLAHIARTLEISVDRARRLRDLHDTATAQNAETEV
jgi:DNA-binding transcriptional regulator LsrR (DeoR family)